MAEKSFRQIEAEIADKGYESLFTEAVYDLQNFTRTVSYLLEGHEDELSTVAKQELNALTGSAMRLGLGIYQFNEKYVKYLRNE